MPPSASGDDTDGNPSDRRRTLIAAYAAVLVLLVAGFSVAVYAHIQRDRTDAALDSAQAQLDHTTAELTGARAELATLTATSTAAARALTSGSAQLATDQAQLAKARTDLNAQGVSISDLDTCLAGVERSLNQIALSNESAAAATLNGVATSCKDAEPSGP